MGMNGLWAVNNTYKKYIYIENQITNASSKWNADI